MGRKQIYIKKEVAKTLKKTGYLTQKAIDQHPSLPTHMIVLRLFKTNTMNDIWKELGIPIIPRSSYTKEKVFKVLKKLGRLSQKEIDQHPGLPSCRTVLRLFKTTKLSDVWRELGIPSPSNYTKEEAFKILKETGYLSQKEINQHPYLPSCSTILRLFKTTKMSDIWEKVNPRP